MLYMLTENRPRALLTELDGHGNNLLQEHYSGPTCVCSFVAKLCLVLEIWGADFRLFRITRYSELPRITLWWLFQSW